MISPRLRAQDFYPRQVFVAGEECRLRISLDLNAPIPSVQPDGTLIESTEQPVSVALGQVCLTWPQRLHAGIVPVVEAQAACLYLHLSLFTFGHRAARLRCARPGA
jgi:hypothetical protein